MHNLFLVYFVNLYMFRAYLGPWSGGTTICIQQLVLIILFRWLTVVLVGQQTEKNYSFLIILFRWLSVVLVGQQTEKNNKYQLLYTYGCTSWWWAKTRKCWWNILRISCASSWFFFTQFRDVVEFKHSFRMSQKTICFSTADQPFKAVT
jgi:hypothetical protein